MELAGVKLTHARDKVFAAVRELARSAGGAPQPRRTFDLVLPSRASIPYLNEPWYC